VNELSLFALNASREFGQRVAEALGIPLAEHEEREFEDGEHKARPLESVRGRDVYVVHSLYGDAAQSVNDKLVRLLFFLGALRDASAARITAVLPYLCYARKDRRTKTRDPVSTRYLATLLETVGADRVVTLDVHNLAAYENAFRVRAEHLEARRLFVDHFSALLASEDAAVVSPDVGGVKRAEAFREALERRLKRPVARAFMEKQRSAGVVSGERLVGEVAGRVVIIIDDLISSGTTLARAAAACGGARKIYAAASHGLFAQKAGEVLGASAIERLVVTDTVPPFRLTAGAARDKLTVLSTAPLFAEAICRMHSGGSLVELLEVRET
jgi:ribose-phosphate pyrophosphokinase